MATKKEEQFFYLDKQGKEQGPFSVGQMRFWFEKKRLTKDLRVKEKNSGEDYSAINKHQPPFSFTLPKDADVASITHPDSYIGKGSSSSTLSASKNADNDDNNSKHSNKTHRGRIENIA